MKNYFNKFMKISYNFSPLLHNRIILYTFCIVALFELVYFLSINDMYSFSTLILIGLLTSFFNKNMTVILFIAIVFTHVLKYGRSSFSEGMENKDETETVETESTETDSSKKEKTDSPDNVMADLSKFKDLSDKINSMTGDEKKNDLIEHLQDIKETRDQIVENVQNMQPLFEKFQGYIEKFQDYKNSQKMNA